MWIIRRIYELRGIKKILEQPTYEKDKPRKSKAKRRKELLKWLRKYKEVNKFYNLYGCDVEGVDPETFVDYRINFMGNRDRLNYSGKPFSQVGLLKAKFQFYKYMSVNGIPVVPVFAFLCDGRLYDVKMNPVDPDATLGHETNLFVKCIDGLGGDGVYHFADYAAYKASADKLAHGKFIIQHGIRQAADINAMYSGAINTLRLVTTNDGQNVSVFAAAFRIATSYSGKVDNLSAGGIAVGVNPDGSLKEWADDFYEDNNAHRHQSHVYAVFPGHSVTPRHELFPAFHKAEEKRFGEGLNEMSAWGAVYMAGGYARLRDGEKAFTALSETVRNTCANNLFSMSNDWRRMGSLACEDFRLAPFQIDANIGFPGVVNEMLVNSSTGTIELLPALPGKWSEGSIKGLLCVGGITACITWNDFSAEAVLTGVKKATQVTCGSGYTFANGETELTVTSDTVLQLIENPLSAGM